MYKTERLYLRTVNEVTIDAVLDYYRDNKKHLDAFEPIREPSFYTYREQSIMLEQDYNRLRDKTGLRLFISKTGTERIIGVLNYSSIIYGGFLSCFMGYGLAADAVGYGYMTEAILKGIEIMFNDYGLHRIEANIMPRNKKSIHVVERCQFKSEGISKNYLRINGTWEDHIHYVLLNEDMS